MIKTRADLQRLILDKVAESKTLEYKRNLPGREDGGNVKILQSITSFANTNGGELLYGVEAVDGVPIALPGIDMALSADEIRLRIEQLCKDGVQERLPDIGTDFIEVENGKSILAIHVPKSWASPHRVIIGGHAHFYARKTGSYPMDVSELRSAFSLSQGIAEKADEFRAGRISRILENDAPVPISPAGKLVLHIMSAGAFGFNSEVGVIPTREQRQAFAPMGWVPVSSHLNFDGYVSYSNLSSPNVAYTQQFRRGIVETMLAFERFKDGNEFYLPPHWYEILLIKNVGNYVSALEELGFSSPYFIGLSFLKIANYQLITNPRSGSFPKQKLDRENLILPMVAIENLQHINSPMRALFDMIWNAFGLEGSKYFDNDANWIGPPLDS